jgi:hypothetical protein
MKKYIGLAAFFGLMLGCGNVFAQDDGQKMQSITFEDDRIEGDLMMPNGTTIDTIEADDKISLVKARDEFDGSTRKSVDEL